MWQKRIYTPVELLIMAICLCFLVGILFPVYYRGQAVDQDVRCKNNLKANTLAMHMYLQDSFGRFPNPRTCYFKSINPFPGETAKSAWGSSFLIRWCNRQVYLGDHPDFGSDFFHYIGDARRLACPTFKRIARTWRHQELFYPYQPIGHNYMPWYNYTMNIYLDSAYSSRRETVSSIDQIEGPATTLTFAEESCLREPAFNSTAVNDTVLYAVLDHSQWIEDAGGNLWDAKPGPISEGGLGRPMIDLIGGMHFGPPENPLRGTGNCAFVDGHVAGHSRQDTFALAYPFKTPASSTDQEESR